MREIPHTILLSHISIVNILGRLHNPLQAPEHPVREIEVSLQGKRVANKKASR